MVDVYSVVLDCPPYLQPRQTWMIRDCLLRREELKGLSRLLELLVNSVHVAATTLSSTIGPSHREYHQECQVRGLTRLVAFSASLRLRERGTLSVAGRSVGRCRPSSAPVLAHSQTSASPICTQYQEQVAAVSAEL